MTADAKVGLLLGLFFIVIIAFLVNGLPSFVKDNQTSTASAAIVSSPSDQTGEDIWFGNDVPGAADRLFNRSKGKSDQAPLVLDAQDLQDLQTQTPNPDPQAPMVVDGSTETGAPAPAKAPEWPKTHRVKSGQILPVIAGMYYGQEHGNRHVVINKLFEANQHVLKSADDVRVGDLLVIPSPEEILGTQQKVVKAPTPTSVLKKFIPDIFEKPTEKQVASVSEYVVGEGESLWSIAEERLGNGTRYKEIIKFNRGRIKNENSVPVGTRLIIPPQ